MNILLLDDEQPVLDCLSLLLRRLGHQVTEAANGSDGWKLYQEGDYHLVLSDIMMPGMSGLDLLEAIAKDEYRLADVVLFTANTGVKTAVNAMRSGAYDYLIKPIAVDELVVMLEKVEEHQLLKRQNRVLTSHFEESIAVATRETRRELEAWKSAYEKASGNKGVIAASEAIKNLLDQARILHEDSSIPVLIEGETGTGKEVLARQIHFGEGAVMTPFIEINCAAIPSSMFENELFGYEGGTFTGALPGGHKGKIDLARGGTLFLDEIAEISPELQAKLLHLLENREYYRVGGLKKRRLEARIIAATNVNIHRNIAQGLFRRDLYYRLNTSHLVIPPLRERSEDILPLARYFLRRYVQDKGKYFRDFSREAVDKLLNYDWPGNVRELKNAIESAVLLNEGITMEAEHLKLASISSGQLERAESCSLPVLDPDLDYILPEAGFPLQRFNDVLIDRALAMHHGNISQTARYLHISRRSLDYRLQKKGVRG